MREVKKANRNSCIKNLIWELFQFSHNLSGCERVKLNARKEVFNDKVKYHSFNINLSKDLFTVKATTRKKDKIVDGLSGIKFALANDRTLKESVDLDKMHGYVNELTAHLNKDRERSRSTEEVSFSPENIDEEVKKMSTPLKALMLEVVIPKTIDHIEREFAEGLVEDFDAYKELKKRISDMTTQVGEQVEAGVQTLSSSCLLFGEDEEVSE